jgi:alpha-1,2-mannosyltransferase
MTDPRPPELRAQGSWAVGIPLRLQRALDLGLVVLIVGLGLLSWHRAAHGEFDFEHFYLDAHYLWTHGELNPSVDDPDPSLRRRLPFYLPVVTLVLSPLTAFGRQPAALAWAFAQVAALGYCLNVLRRWGVGRDARAPAVAAFAAALLLAIPAFLEASKFNQLSYFVLALVLGATSALDRDRPARAGVLLGLATMLKLLPGIFLVWLVLKRRWSAVGAFVLTALVVSLVPSLAFFGPQRTAEYHRQWWAYNVQGDAAQGLLNADLREHFIDWRNQSIAQVVARLAWPEHPYAMRHQPLHLDRRTCAWLAGGISVLLLAALVWCTRRWWTALSVERRHAEAAVYAIAMLVLSPLLRQYYLVWALPGLVLLARAAAGGTFRRWGQIGLVIWAIGMLAWLWPAARLLGAHLIMLMVLGVLLLCVTRSPGSAPQNVGAISDGD